MKFVDEAVIQVAAGNGGNGCLSFLREKYRPDGGPDGGDGGHGGSVYLVVNDGLNTLVDFRHSRLYRARSGEGGQGRGRSGKNGDDCLVRVPRGTVVSDAHSGELIGDLLHSGQKMQVAVGGLRGLGNARFKSSINRAPRKITHGKPGDQRQLKLELKLLADVGLLGLPNAGKSTFLTAVSRAHPKVADYPFTTLHPQLGMVDAARVGVNLFADELVIADIPGLIAGAANGAGLGTHFLKHLKRTSILLHLIDAAPADGRDAIASVREIESELVQFDSELATKPRWLVLNKSDLLAEGAAQSLLQRLRAELDWQQPIYVISALTRQGCGRLIRELMARFAALPTASIETAADRPADSSG